MEQQAFMKMERTYNASMKIWGICNGTHYTFCSISQINGFYLTRVHS